MKDSVDLVVHGIAAGKFEIVVKAGLLREERGDLSLARVREFLVQGVKFVVDFGEAGEGPCGRLPQRVLGIDVGILREKPDSRTPLHRDGSRVRLQPTRDQLEERALSATVATDEADLLARLDREHRLIEEQPRPMAKADIRKRGDGHSPILAGYPLDHAHDGHGGSTVRPSVRRIARLLVLPLVVLVVGRFVIRYVDAQASDRCRRVQAEVAALVADHARDPSVPLVAFSTSEQIVVSELRSRLDRAVKARAAGATSVLVESGDLDPTSDQQASHTARITMPDGSEIGLRLRVGSDESPLLLIGVFTPQARESGEGRASP